MEKSMCNRRGIELGLGQLLRLLWKKLWLIGLAMACCAVISVLITSAFVTPIYRSTAIFYVNIGGIDLPANETAQPGKTDEDKTTIDSGSIAVAKDLIDSYNVILHTRQTLIMISESSGIQRSPEELSEMLNLIPVGETEIFQVTVSGTRPQEVWRIAQGICQVLPQRIEEVVEQVQVKIVETPILSTSPSAPSYALNGIIGLYTGMLISVSTLIVLELLRIRIRSEEDVALYTDAPILAAIPDMSAGGREHYYGYVTKTRHTLLTGGTKRELVGEGISFEASEAFKLLRTRLDFAVSGGEGARVLAITSAVSGEGKSLTAANLAYNLSQLSHKVLLVDVDLRRPTVGTRLPVLKSPGLSEWLSGQCSLRQTLQPCGLRENENAFQVISSGTAVTNSVEMLSSRRFRDLISDLRRRYDYILLDLPAADDISDALVASEWADEVVLVVRPNVCRCSALKRTVEQLRYLHRPVAGIVYNCASQRHGGAYSKKYYGPDKRKYIGTYLAKDKKTQKK